MVNRHGGYTYKYLREWIECLDRLCCRPDLATQLHDPFYQPTRTHPQPRWVAADVAGASTAGSARFNDGNLTATKYPIEMIRSPHTIRSNNRRGEAGVDRLDTALVKDVGSTESPTFVGARVGALDASRSIR
jgi:hypothetical protein